WYEVDFKKMNVNADSLEIAKRSQKKWFPYNKGGEYRKWYGNCDYVINYENDGSEIKSFHEILNLTSPGGRLKNQDCYFKPQVSWSKISSGDFCVRYYPSGFIFDVAGSAIFPKNEDVIFSLCGMLNSRPVKKFLEALSPTLNYEAEHVKKLPCVFVANDKTSELISISKEDWNSQEISWGFNKNSLITQLEINKPLRNIYIKYRESLKEVLKDSIKIERELNDDFNQAYAIENKKHELKLSECTLLLNPFYRYQIEDENDAYNRLLADHIGELISYIIGCQMGRYSLDREGLIYAHESNKGFAELVAKGAYKTFPADQDGILPLMDSDWFDDDVTARVKEFIRIVWGEEHLQENLDFIAESLCLYAIKPKKGESSLDTIRRYLSTQFWKDHMKMYKKRPIYWLFSSGKEKAFECLVYLHRYNEGTLSRMRTEYVVPLLARYQGNIDLVNDQLKSAESGTATTRLKKELDGLTKKFNELRNFDDRLRHYADRRITIDLDDGVKVNYGKFGDLLADVKAITGSAPEEI
ncbi:TPA: BREX-1 system adenine-specific DNA-methyltransferase PglX, partial [Klebsiella pneumoniae]|nr:BREX-1 system adenine-specific DNA-methyltransferase PglX [Klebsiella pneumoniae]